MEILPKHRLAHARRGPDAARDGGRRPGAVTRRPGAGEAAGRHRLHAPGEWHGHDAAPEHFMTHLALWEAAGTGDPETEWGEHVGDDVYAGPRA